MPLDPLEGASSFDWIRKSVFNWRVCMCSSYVFWNCRFVFLNILSQILKPLQNQWMCSSYVFWNCRFVFFNTLSQILKPLQNLWTVTWDLKRSLLADQVRVCVYCGKYRRFHDRTLAIVKLKLSAECVFSFWYTIVKLKLLLAGCGRVLMIWSDLQKTLIQDPKKWRFLGVFFGLPLQTTAPWTQAVLSQCSVGENLRFWVNSSSVSLISHVSRNWVDRGLGSCIKVFCRSDHIIKQDFLVH